MLREKTLSLDAKFGLSLALYSNHGLSTHVRGTEKTYISHATKRPIRKPNPLQLSIAMSVLGQYARAALFLFFVSHLPPHSDPGEGPHTHLQGILPQKATKSRRQPQPYSQDPVTASPTTSLTSQETDSDSQSFTSAVSRFAVEAGSHSSTDAVYQLPVRMHPRSLTEAGTQSSTWTLRQSIGSIAQEPIDDDDSADFEFDLDYLFSGDVVLSVPDALVE